MTSKFYISRMSDFRLEVFYTVAKRLSFTKAAAELFITQPAVTKHIHELEHQYKAKLIERKGNYISLTPQGELLYQHAQKVFELYREVEYKINAVNNKNAGLLKIGASTTIAQYIIGPVLARFKQQYPDIELRLDTGNTEQIERKLLAKDVDCAIIEGYSKNTEISYREFLKDEIVLACSSKHFLARRSSLKSQELKDLNFVFREHGSGTQEVIEHALKGIKISLAELPVEMYLGNTESIKSYLLHSACVAFVSIYAIANEVNRGELTVIDVKGLNITRSFYLVSLHGKETTGVNLFSKFSLSIV